MPNTTSKLTQFEWLMHKLEPKEALELRAAKDALMSRHLDEQAESPLFYFEERVAANLTVSDVLSVGFVWDSTPQGHGYWKAVYEKYKALESIQQRKDEDDGR